MYEKILKGLGVEVEGAESQRDATAASLNLFRYPMVISTGTLKQATGYRFWHTSMDALTAYANSNILVKD